MITECECLQETYRFTIWQKRIEKWYYNIPMFEWSNFPIKTQIIIIHGKSLNDIQIKRDAIIRELKVKYPDETHIVRSYS